MVETGMSSPSTTNMIAEVDRISKLPNTLIHYILSFIDTKYAVQTCVLSKRWIDIWKSLPFLNFDIDGYPSAQYALSRSDTMNNFVDRVLLLRDDCSSIQRFKVSWSFNNEPELSEIFNRWIDAAVKCSVEEVTIELTSQYWDLTYQVSPRLLNSKSLEKLTLRISCEEDGIHSADVVFPESISLPQLKFMCLDGYLECDGKSIERLISGCPVLETLHIANCDIQTDTGKLTVESPSLRQFAYECGGYSGQPKLVLSAPNLKKYTRKSHWINQDCYLENGFDQLSDVNLDVVYSSELGKQQLEEKQVYARQMVKLLAAVDKVKRLELSHGFLEVLSSATDLAKCQLRCLHNLQYLRLGTWLTRDNLRTIAYFLSISPIIKTLILISNPDGATWNYFHSWRSSERGLLESDLEDIEDDWEAGLSLPGMLSHLNRVRMENVEGCEAELKLLSLLLKNAEGLKEVAMYPCDKLGSNRELREKFENKLKALPGASSLIKVWWRNVRLIPCAIDPELPSAASANTNIEMNEVLTCPSSPPDMGDLGGKAYSGNTSIWFAHFGWFPACFSWFQRENTKPEIFKLNAKDLVLGETFSMEVGGKTNTMVIDTNWEDIMEKRLKQCNRFNFKQGNSMLTNLMT